MSSFVSRGLAIAHILFELVTFWSTVALKTSLASSSFIIIISTPRVARLSFSGPLPGCGYSQGGLSLRLIKSRSFCAIWLSNLLTICNIVDSIIFLIQTKYPGSLTTTLAPGKSNLKCLNWDLFCLILGQASLSTDRFVLTFYRLDPSDGAPRCWAVVFPLFARSDVPSCQPEPLVERLSYVFLKLYLLSYLPDRLVA